MIVIRGEDVAGNLGNDEDRMKPGMYVRSHEKGSRIRGQIRGIGQHENVVIIEMFLPYLLA